MRKEILLVLVFSIVSLLSFSQEDGDLSASDWKMTQAKMFYGDNKIEPALEIYNELLVDYPNNDLLNLRISECYFILMDYEKAKSFADNSLANNLDKEILPLTHFLIGAINHKINDFDKAIASYSIICSGTSEKDSTEIIKLIAQAEVGKIQTENPFNYFVENLGSDINSEYNEISPVFSWAEKLLYFTTDRSVKENQEKNLITYLFRKSILEAYVDEKGFASKPEIVDEVFTNAKGFTLTSITLADKGFYIFKNTPEVSDGGDIYYVERLDDEDFSQPKRINQTVNTQSLEGGASIDFLNNEMFFVTNKNDKTKTNSDIYLSYYKRGNHSTDLAITTLNTDYDENSVYVHPGGDFIVFSSNSDKSMGGYDLFISENKNGKWQDAKNLGYPINSTSDEMSFTISPDGKYAYFASNRQGGFGRYDIYKLEIGPYFLEQTSINPQLIIVTGELTNEDGEAIETTINITNPFNEKDSQKISTDVDGYFSFVVKKSKYNIEIKQKPYATFEQEIDLMQVQDSYFEKDFELTQKK